MGDAMNDVFFLVVGIIIAAVGLLLIMAKVFSYILTLTEASADGF